MGLEIKIIKEQLENLIKQRDNHAALFQQCAGAISVLSEQLQMLQSEDDSNQDNLEPMDCIDVEGEFNNGRKMDSENRHEERRIT